MTNDERRETPVVEGTVRGMLAGALMAVLAFLQIEYEVISEQGALALAPVVTFASFMLGGLYDRFFG